MTRLVRFEYRFSLARLSLFLIATLLGPSPEARGIIVEPHSYARVSEDHQRLFVMIVQIPPSAKERRHDLDPPKVFVLPDGRSIVLQDTFKKSGCYDCKTLALIWPVEWDLDESDLRFSPDFDHIAGLVRYGFSADNGVAFFEKGKISHIYKVSELLTALKDPIYLEYSTENYHTKWYSQFEQDGDRITLTTERRRLGYDGYRLDLGLQETYVFDLSTGVIISSESTGMVKIWFYICTTAVVLPSLVMGAWFLRENIKKS